MIHVEVVVIPREKAQPWVGISARAFEFIQGTENARSEVGRRKTGAMALQLCCVHQQGFARAGLACTRTMLT